MIPSATATVTGRRKSDYPQATSTAAWSDVTPATQQDTSTVTAAAERETESRHHQRQHQHSHQTRIGNYDFVRTIGEGSFAKVKLGVHRLTGEKVAIKVVDKTTLPDTYSQTHLHREAQIMRMLDHPNIVQLIEVMETKRELYLVLEYASGGEVLDYIVAHGRLKEVEARRFVGQIVGALKYCHDRSIVHRDLKAENLLLDSTMQIKISDFGLSNVFNPSKHLSTCCGSPVYSAPELIEGKKYIGPEVDAWSLGVNIYAMVVGDLPFAEKELKKLYERVLVGRYEVPGFVSDECKDLIHKLLVTNPSKRYTMAQVLQHPWMQHEAHSRSFEVDSTTTSATTSKARSRRLSQTKKQNSQQAIPHIRPQTHSELDAEILAKMEELGFNKQSATRDVVSGKFNQAAGTYFLLALKKRKEGGLGNGKEIRVFEESVPAASVGPTPLREDVTSEELAKVLIKAERSRRTREKSVGEDTTVPARLTARARSKTTGSREWNGKDVPMEDEGDAQISQPTPRTRRHSFSPGELSHNAPPLHRGRSNQGLPMSPPIRTATSSKPSTKPPSATPRPKHPTESLHTTKPGPRPPKLPTPALPPIHTDQQQATLLPATAQPDFPRATNISTASPSTPTFTSPHTITPIPYSASTPTAPHSQSSYLRSRPRAHTIAIDESLYISPTDASTTSLPTSDQAQPRTIRFAFNCYTTTTLPPTTLFSRLLSTLQNNHIEYVSEGFLCACETDQVPQVRFEAEVCKLPRLKMYGLRLKRVSGDMWEYKRVCQRIMEGLEL